MASNHVLRPQQQAGATSPPDWVAYADGSEDVGKAGWAYRRWRQLS